MSVVRDLILQADDELRYPTGGELSSMVEFLKGGSQRLRIVQVLTENERKIVAESAKQLFSRKPDYVAPGGNAYGQKQRAQCLRDFSWYLRLVTYGVLAGSTSSIETIGLAGARASRFVASSKPPSAWFPLRTVLCWVPTSIS